MLDTDLKTKFKRDGYVFPVDVFTPDEMSEFREKFDQLEQESGKDFAQKGLAGKEREYKFVWWMATGRRVIDAVESVYGPNLVLLSTHFFCKYPVSELGTAFVAWHQDVTYWGLQPAKAMSVWIAVDDVDEENGAMLFIPGSHRHGFFEHGKSDRTGNLLSVNQAIDESLFDVTTAVTVELKAGQMSLHDGMMIHGSHPNRSDRRRCGMTVRFTTPDVRMIPEENKKSTWQAVLVRGEDHHDVQKRLPAPVFSP